jgi:hypothetical protein
MASYRYERDIDPKDIAPRKERQYTRKERWANWWDYNLKWVIIIGIAAAFVAYNFIGQYFFTTKADYNVAVVAPYYLPEDTVNALQDALAAYGEDRNGDGKVVVTLNVYTLDYSDTETQTESAAYLTMAGTTKLATDVQGGLSSVFLLWDPAGFEESTGSPPHMPAAKPQRPPAKQASNHNSQPSNRNAHPQIRTATTKTSRTTSPANTPGKWPVFSRLPRLLACCSAQSGA